MRQLLPRLITQNEPEKKLVWLLGMAGPLHAFLHALTIPLSGILNLFKRMYQEADEKVAEEDPETTDEEIQAYLDIGEDQGIIEEEDSELIQSVVEFGDTLVREVMTPRTEIVACTENATIAELRDIMVLHRHSRIPIFREDMDHIIGIAYIRQLLAHTVKGEESESITGLVQPALFVPESKRVSTLLKELQERGGQAAIVIDEFGGVAGMVTIEDLVEEIVGEIRDEDQTLVSEVIEDGPGRYIMRGSTELHQLEELTGKRLDRGESSTVAGLITAYLGRVPAPGEEFDIDELRIQILDADRRRVHKIRLRLAQSAG
jgi:CBS domain containing-hemolysin-like protein